MRKECALRELAIVQNVWGAGGAQQVVTSEVGKVVGTDQERPCVLS